VSELDQLLEGITEKEKGNEESRNVVTVKMTKTGKGQKEPEDCHGKGRPD